MRINPNQVNMPVPSTVKIVCFSDTHDKYNLGVLKETYKGDLLLHAGDATSTGELRQLSAYSDWLAKQKFDSKIIIPGNHDLAFEKNWELAEAHVPDATAILNQSTTLYNGLKIWGEPRQPWFYDWAFNVQREHMGAVWDLVPKDTDILVTHGPPFGAGDINGQGVRCGCVAQRKWIEENQPRLVVCGHIHDGYGIYLIGKTLVVNASICNGYYEPDNQPITVELSL